MLKKFKRLLIKILFVISPLLPSKLYLKLLFPLRAGYRLNLRNPKTYNEKLQWLKLYYRDMDLPERVDKYGYKEWAKKIVGEEYLPVTYGVWDSWDDIDWTKLPSKFVLKTTHDQGGVVICEDKSNFDFDTAKEKINKHLKNNLYYRFREWPYKHVKPRIIAEEFLEDLGKGDLWDYKFYCFDGEPQVMYISMGRQGEHTPFYFYDMEFNQLDIIRPGHEPLNDAIEKPSSWEEMKLLARTLSAGQPHVRIDFYSIDGRIYLGEYTLFQGAGMMPFEPKEWDYKLGSYITLVKNNAD